MSIEVIKLLGMEFISQKMMESRYVPLGIGRFKRMETAMSAMKPKQCNEDEKEAGACELF